MKKYYEKQRNQRKQFISIPSSEYRKTRIVYTKFHTKLTTLYDADSCIIHMPKNCSFRRRFVGTPKMLHGISFALLKTGNIACVMIHLHCSFMNLHKKSTARRGLRRFLYRNNSLVLAHV